MTALSKPRLKSERRTWSGASTQRTQSKRRPLGKLPFNYGKWIVWPEVIAMLALRAPTK